MQIEIPEGQTVLSAAAYRHQDGELDGTSYRDLRHAVQGQRLTWTAPKAGWLLAVVASQPHDLDYLNPEVAARWLEIYWQEHEERLQEFVGNTLKLYGQDELYVLNGCLSRSDSFGAVGSRHTLFPDEGRIARQAVVINYKIPRQQGNYHEDPHDSGVRARLLGTPLQRH